MNGHEDPGSISQPPTRTPEYNRLARYFDLINEKYVPYAGQCDFLEAAFRRYGKRVSAILDLACGTGLHAFDLSRRGYRVTGVDRSPEILAEARRKAAGLGAPVAGGGREVVLLPGDMRDLHFTEEFEAAFAFNFPVAYCLDHAEIGRFLQGVSRALKPGGIFLFDFFSHYNTSPGVQQESAEDERVRIDCAREFSFDPLRQVLLERNMYTVYDKADGSLQTLEGYDEFRVYYPQEVRHYLETMGGFRLLGFHRRWDIEGEASRSDLVAVGERQ